MLQSISGGNCIFQFRCRHSNSSSSSTTSSCRLRRRCRRSRHAALQPGCGSSTYYPAYGCCRVMLEQIANRSAVKTNKTLGRFVDRSVIGRDTPLKLNLKTSQQIFIAGCRLYRKDEMAQGAQGNRYFVAMAGYSNYSSIFHMQKLSTFNKKGLRLLCESISNVSQIFRSYQKVTNQINVEDI